MEKLLQEIELLKKQLSEKNAALASLERNLRKSNRELNSANAQLNRIKIAASNKDRASSILSSEKALRELYLNSLLKVMPELVLFVDTNLKVFMCSESYLDATGMSYDEVIGIPAIPDWLSYPNEQSISAAEQEIVNVIETGVPLEEEIHFSFRSDHPKRYYKKYILPLFNSTAQAVGVFMLFIDVTDISEAREEARKASKAKGSFLANMSHEIRTPMNAVIGMTDIAQSSDDIEQKNYCLDKIHSASVHLLGVINDILDMSKIESGKMTIAPTEFDFEKMLKRVTGVIGYSVEAKQQTFTVDIDDNLPRYIISDEQRLS